MVILAHVAGRSPAAETGRCVFGAVCCGSPCFISAVIGWVQLWGCLLFSATAGKEDSLPTFSSRSNPTDPRATDSVARGCHPFFDQNWVRAQLWSGGFEGALPEHWTVVRPEAGSPRRCESRH